jgi:hypothetical protein
MSLTPGTNCGFVTVAPTADPMGGALSTVDDRSAGIKFTSPALEIIVIEMGWWCNEPTEAANFDIGVYSDAAGGTEPDDRLYVSANNAKGTSSGWKVVTGLAWALSASTPFWLAVQLDNTMTTTNSDSETSGGTGAAVLLPGQTALPDPWGTSTAVDADNLGAFYALYVPVIPRKIHTYRRRRAR